MADINERRDNLKEIIYNEFGVLVSEGAVIALTWLIDYNFLNSPDIAGLAENSVPYVEGGTLVSSDAVVDSATKAWTFAHTIEVPGGSIDIGEVTSISSATGHLIVRDEVQDHLSYLVDNEFDSTGADIPHYINWGAEYNLDVQLDFSQTLDSNPLIWTDTSTVLDPNTRQIVSTTFKTGSVMTNVRAKITDSTTGLALRYIPSKVVWDTGLGGITTIAGDNLFNFLSTEDDTPGVYNLGIQPWLTHEAQEFTFEVRADSVDMLGDISGHPYQTVIVQDGPHVNLALEETADRVQTTGWLEGGIISEATSTTVNWTSGRGIIADYTNPETPVINPDTTWDAVTGQSITNIATDGTTVFGYDINGGIIQKLTTALTIEDAHNYIWFGNVFHLSGAIVHVSTEPGNIGYNGVGALRDFQNLVIGPANSVGNIYGAYSNDLRISVVGGQAQIQAANARNNPQIPDTITLPSDVSGTLAFRKVHRTADPGLSVVYSAEVTNIDPDYYDDGSGTLVAVTAGYWTIQRIFRDRRGDTYVAPGQQEFSNRSLALEALGNEPFTEKSPLPFMLFRCSLLIQQGATELSDLDEAEFFEQSSFRISGAQSSSASIPGVTSPGGIDGAIQFNNSNVFGGDSNFLYDSTLKTIVLEAAVAGSATYEFANSSDVVKGIIRYAETADEFSISATGTTSEIHLNDAAYVHRGTIDGRIDTHAITNAGCALLTLSNFAGGTGLSIEHDDATDESIIDSEIGNLTIKTTTGTDDIILAPVGNVGVNKTDPDSVLHIYEDTTETGIQAGLTIEQDGAGDAITQYLLTAGQRWVTGIDNSGSDAFKIASSLDLASNAQLVLETDGRSEFLGKLGVNILPTSNLHIYEDNSLIDATVGLTIEQDGLGDALVQFLLTGGQRWIAGIDNSSSSNDFGISGRGALSGTTNNLTLDDTQGLILKNDSSATAVFDTISGIRLDNIDTTDGNFTSVVNYGAANISSGIAFVNDDYSANIGHIEFGIRGAGGFTHALTLQEGNYGNANSTNLIFNIGDEGTNQSEFVLFNDSDASELVRYFRLSYADQIATQGGINISDANNYVSIGTRTDPDSVLHLYENTTETGDQAGLTIEQDGTGDAITQYLLSGGQRWVTGIDNSGSDAFKISSSINLGTNDQLVLETDGRSEFLGSLGVSILPVSTFHVYEDTAEVGTAAGLTIEQDGAGDVVAQFLVTGGQRWVMGIDNSQSDEFCISSTLDLNSNKRVVLQTDGRNYFNGTLGIGQVPESGYRLDVLTSISVHTRLSTFKAVTIESGKNGSGNSTDLFFNRGGVGFNQSEFAMYNENSSSGSARYFRMGYSDDIDTSGGLTVWKTRNNVAVGSYTQPDSVLTVSEDTTETGDQAGLTIIQEGTGDAIAQFLLDGGQRWVMGIDNSGNDAFKIASSIDLGSNDMFVLEPDAGAFIYSHTDDVLTLGNSTGETSKISVDNAGSPEGVVTGTGGDIHVHADSVRSTASLKKSTASSTADWYDFDLVPPNLKVIYNTAELEAMATFSVITISSSTTWAIKGHLSSDVRIEFTNNATLHIVTDNSNQSSWAYTGTGTMFSGAGRLRALEFFDLIGNASATFCNLELNGGSVNLTLAGVFEWGDLGTINNGTLILDVSDIFDNVLGWDLFNCKVTLTKSNITNTPTTALPFLTIDNSIAVESKSISVDQMSGTFVSGASLFRIEPGLSDIPKNLISACIFGGGNLFDTSGSTGEFTVVADASVPTESITSVTDSSGVARFNFSAPPTLFVNQEVVISGYGTRTSFNGTWLITATGAGYFEIASIDYEAGVDSGSFISNSVTMTDTGTTLVDGDQVTIDTDGSSDYDGGTVVYNQLTNTFQVNKTWIATGTGTWSQAGLDQTDPRILAQANPGFADSNYLCFGHIEENPVTNATTISVADTYQAIDISGTTGSITVFATNGAGGTTCTSTGHDLVENQNVVLTLGDEYYRGKFTVFNVLTNTFDIAIAFQSTVLTSTWTAGFQSENERFKTIDPTIGLVEYIGNEPFEGAVIITWSVYKSGSSEDYLFSSGKNGVAPEQGAAYQKRTVTTSTSVHPVTVPVNLVKGDTIQPILASVTTTNSITVENLQIEIS